VSEEVSNLSISEHGNFKSDNTKATTNAATYSTAKKTGKVVELLKAKNISFNKTQNDPLADSI
jgi:hypothetical protein